MNWKRSIFIFPLVIIAQLFYNISGEGCSSARLQYLARDGLVLYREAANASPLSLRGGSLPFFGSQEVGFSVP
jgi:hypothetical protein